MSKFGCLAGLCLAGGLALSPAALADLYGAEQAYKKQDFVQAFALYRELAELGHPVAQENVAAMYLAGEGVKRDNVLGYGWALIARENGGGDAMQNIISQLEPHVTEAARIRVTELQAKFGKAALQESLLPVNEGPATKTQTTPIPDNCAFLQPANPDSYYPPSLVRLGLSGNVLLEYTVMPDGRARSPRVVLSVPSLVFDEGARNAIFNSTFKPRMKEGVAVPCSMRVKIKFVSKRGTIGSTDPALKRNMEAAHKQALAGDPNSQLDYGLLLLGVGNNNMTGENPKPWFLKAAQAGLPTAQYMVGSYLPADGNSQDERKALIWLNKAVDARQPDAQATLANYLLRHPEEPGNRARAIELLKLAVVGESREARFYLAALLASEADESRRDPRRALELLGQVMEERDTDPSAWEIRAAANAMLGDFKAAQSDQKRALRMAEKLGWDVAPQKARLEKYENNSPWSGDLLAL